MLRNLFNWEKRGNKLDNINQSLKNSFSGVKKEFEEHLEAINENTNEIQSNYELLLKLESRLDKIENKLSEIDIFIRQFKTQNVYFLEENEKDSFMIMPLNDDEKRVFNTIYELEAENINISYQKLSEVLGVSTSLVREYIISLIEKGVPIMKRYLNHKIFLSLEPKFRESQTKRNLVNI